MDTAYRNSTAMLTVLLLAACASKDFVSTWKSPDATPLGFGGAKVAAVVMAQGETTRRLGEDALAREITARGAIGIPMYELLRGARPSDEAAAREACERAGVVGVLVIKPTAIKKDVSEKSVTSLEPTYTGYWGGGYYAHGWETSYVPAEVGTELAVKNTVSIETRVYSLKQNKLVWKGESRRTDPTDVAAEIGKLAAATAAELEKEGLIQSSPAR